MTLIEVTHSLVEVRLEIRGKVILKLSLDFPRRRTPIRDLLYRNRQNRDCRRIAKTRRCLRPIRIRIFRRASRNLSAQFCGIRLRTSQANFSF